MLRELGLGLPSIAEVLVGHTDDTAALCTHLEWLRQQQARLDRQITAVETTVHKLERMEPLMAEE